MPFVLKDKSRILCYLLLAVALLPLRGKAQETRDFSQPLTEKQKISHALNRLTYGPRPGDFEQVQRLGLAQWLEKQLHPETIDDRYVENKLAALSLFHAPPKTLLLAHAADTGLIRRARQIEKQQQEEGATQVLPGQVLADKQKLSLQQLKKLELIEQSGIAPQTSLQALGELQFFKLARAIESERQLYEIMVDFWSNHFNIDVKKSELRALKIIDERETVRPHVFSSFRQLLGASAKSPAMLVYLDNVSSTREMEQNAGRPKKRGGINENYARELLELHTLGVDGGYTQKDVQEVARCFTGWSINRETGEFFFRKYAHDNGEKTVLGQRIPANGGITDGERVLDLLAAHPSTAKFIARKLCLRLVADNPPQTLIDKAAKSFTASQGDLREVVRTIITSPEFFSTGAYRAKIKSPLEYSVSAVRVLGGTFQVPDPIIPAGRAHLVFAGATVLRPGNEAKRSRVSLPQQIAQMGQPLYSYQAPTGYSEISSSWVSTGALVARLNFALDLVENRISDVTTSPNFLLSNSGKRSQAALIDSLLETLLGDATTPGTQSTLQREADQNPTISPKKLVALILGSPEFQRR